MEERNPHVLCYREIGRYLGHHAGILWEESNVGELGSTYARMNILQQDGSSLTAITFNFAVDVLEICQVPTRYDIAYSL